MKWAKGQYYVSTWSYNTMRIWEDLESLQVWKKATEIWSSGSRVAPAYRLPSKSNECDFTDSKRAAELALECFPDV